MRSEHKRALMREIDAVMNGVGRDAAPTRDDLVELRQQMTRALFEAYRLGFSSSERRRESSKGFPAVTRGVDPER